MLKSGPQPGPTTVSTREQQTLNSVHQQQSLMAHQRFGKPKGVACFESRVIEMRDQRQRRRKHPQGGQPTARWP